jgi:hypothetical protein
MVAQINIPDMIKPFFVWLDTYGQWFFVNIVYGQEPWCLIIAACLLAVRRKGVIWGVIFCSLMTFSVTYLVLYRMHLYSWVAWPVMIAVFFLLLSRLMWYRIIDSLLHPGGLLKNLRNNLNCSNATDVGIFGHILHKVLSRIRYPLQSARELIIIPWKTGGRDRRILLGTGLIILGILTVGHILSIPMDLIWILSAVVCGTYIIGVAAANIADCEREFLRYLRSDRRLILYLDVVRKIRAKGRNPVRNFLSSNRLEDPNLSAPGVNVWSVLFRISQKPPISWILRILACREWMPSIASAFVIQHIENERQQVLHKYESSRYRDNSSKMAPNPNVMRHPEFNDVDLRKMRISWLAMTEALAECYVFSSPRKISDTKASLNLLKAAELLGQGGEVQYQLVRDLQQCYKHNAAHKDEDHSNENELREKEICLAIHFLSLSVQCIELWLAPNKLDESNTYGLSERYTRFCGPILDNKEFRGNLLDYRLRCILLERYRLITKLKLLLPLEDSESDKAIAKSNDKPVRKPVAENLTKELKFEAYMAQLSYFGAIAALCIENRHGDNARFLWHSPEERSHDPLAELEVIINECININLTGKYGEPEYRVRNMNIHIRRLAALAFEQEMEHLHPGSEIWWEMCLLAADIYCSYNCSRIHRLFAIAEKAATGGTETSSKEQSDYIIELG